MTVGLVLVSHSQQLADGAAVLAEQMAPEVTIEPAGGSDGGEIGTSFDKISSALNAADSGDGVVVLYDLGSAQLTTETAIEFADEEQAARWRIVDAPLVEGAIAAAVSAQGGADLDAVAAAAQSAGHSGAADIDAAAAGSGADDGPDADRVAQEHRPEPPGVPVVGQVQIVNPLGLHARPSAELARSLAGTSATVRIGRPGEREVDLRSVLGVVGLALRGGDQVQIRVWGPDAAAVLGRLEQTIRSGFGEADQPAGAVADGDTAPRVVGDVVHATAGANGLALGPLVRLGALPVTLPDGVAVPASSAQQAAEQLDAAVIAAAKTLAGQGEFGQAHAALVADPQLRELAAQRLAEGAAGAWWHAVNEQAQRLEAAGDELVAARGVDLREAGLSVLAELGVHLDRIGPDVSGAVALAPDLGPAEVPELVRRGAVGAVLSGSSTTAHAVIVARGLGLPLVLRTGSALEDWPSGTTVLVDGDAGTVQIDPPEQVADSARARIAEAERRADELRAAAAEPLVLPDGRRVLIAANIGSLADATAAVANGAEAVGLLRTELLVLDRNPYPDEDAQTADLTAIFDELGQRPVVVRVLDAGGDKPVATLDVGPQRNGFLGVRGLRYLLENPHLLRTQLRAICRAAVGHHISVMAPMVTVRTEAQAFRDAVDAAVDSLVQDDVPYARPEQIGLMIEVPAAALAAEQFSGVVDFFSVGSNDLASYLMAADRTEPGVAELLDPQSPALQRILDELTSTAEREHIPVAVCGEIAGMPDQAVGLVRRGVFELSMAPAKIPAIKHLLRSALVPRGDDDAGGEGTTTVGRAADRA